MPSNQHKPFNYIPDSAAFDCLMTNRHLNQIAKVANESGPVTQKNIEDMQEEFKYFRTAIQNYLARSPRHIFREVSAV